MYLEMLRATTRISTQQKSISYPLTRLFSTSHPLAYFTTRACPSRPERRHLLSQHKQNERRIRLADSELCRSVIALPAAHKRWKSTSKIESSQNPLSGLWKPTHLQRLHYGSDSVKNYLLECLPSESSKAFIITGSSLANKTKLVKQVEKLLGSKHHAATYSKIGQHAPIKELDEATELALKDESVDTIISIGGGSPIDSAKAISYRLNERKKGKFLYHITIPTTLSAAECTIVAGYTSEEGMKVAVSSPQIAVHVILYVRFVNAIRTSDNTMSYDVGRRHVWLTC